MTSKKNINADPDYGVDSRYGSAKDKEREGIALMEARLDRLKKLPKEQILRARLLQLKLKMEDYLKHPVYDDKNYFAEFLEAYVDTIYRKRIDFAKDINVTPVYVSKVINSLREPNEEFILKLMIHSEKVFKQVGEFHKKIWYQIYFHEKVCDTMANQDEWRSRIENQVKLSSSMVG